MLQRAYDNIESEREEALRVGDTEGAAELMRVLLQLKPLPEGVKLVAEESLSDYRRWLDPNSLREGPLGPGR